MILKLTVKHNYLKNQFIDIRFDDELTIKQVKQKIQTMTGTMIRNQRLLLKKSDTQMILLSDKNKLKDYQCSDGMELHVIDQNSNSIAKQIGETDVSKLPQRVASDEMYDKCENNVMKQIAEKMKNDEYRKQIELQSQARKQAQEEELKLSHDIQIGQTVWLDGKEECIVKQIKEMPNLGKGLYYTLVRPNSELVHVKHTRFTVEQQEDEIDEL